MVQTKINKISSMLRKLLFLYLLVYILFRDQNWTLKLNVKLSLFVFHLIVCLIIYILLKIPFKSYVLFEKFKIWKYLFIIFAIYTYVAIGK